MQGIFSIFTFLATPLGWVMRMIYEAVGSYGLTLILFTLITKVAMIPASISQQKSAAKQSAYMPMIQEIQKKWARDERRKNEELAKLQQEFGYSPLAGCLPMLITFPVMLGMIDVIYKPLKHILAIPEEAITAATDITKNLGITLTNYSPQTGVIQAIQQNPGAFSSVISAEELARIQGFSQLFLGMDLAAVPEIALSLLILVPILTAVSMILLQTITMKLNGTAEQMQGSMKYMNLFSAGMMAWMAFQMPVGVSLYWIFGNVISILLAFVLNKIYSPQKYKEELEAEIAAKKQAKKDKKKTTITKTDGDDEIEVEVTDTELNKLRLEKARELDKSIYDE